MADSIDVGSWAGLLQSTITGRLTYIPTTTDFLDRYGLEIAGTLVGYGISTFINLARPYLAEPPPAQRAPRRRMNGDFGVDTLPPDVTVDPQTGDVVLTDTGAGGADTVFDPGALDLGGLTSVAHAIGGGGMMRTGGAGAALGAAGVVAGGLTLRAMSQIVAGAILKLKQALGGGGFLTASGIASFGARTWSAITQWAARNPGLSVISTLVGLGLTVEEAAHFLAWGATHKRRRRRRGISYRDMRTTRRTMGRVISMAQQLRALCGAVP